MALLTILLGVLIVVPTAYWVRLRLPRLLLVGLNGGGGHLVGLGGCPNVLTDGLNGGR